MTRLTLDPNNFAAQVKQVLSDIQDLKNPQIVGASSLIAHTITTGNVWDINDSVPAFAENRYRVTFTPDPNQNSKPYAEFFFAYAVGNSDGFEVVAWYPDPANTTSDATRSFLLIFTNDFNVTTFLARVGIKSSHTGSIGITPA